MSLFYPTCYRRRITNISLDELHQMGVKGLLLDVDNTLTTHDCPTLNEDVSRWLKVVQQAGFMAIIVSNNHRERVQSFAQAIGLPYQASAGKPLPRGFRAAAAKLGVPEKQCLVIGDQIFTDIVGANLAGMPSVLLEPIQLEVEQKFIVFKRRLERLLLRGKQAARREEEYRG